MLPLLQFNKINSNIMELNNAPITFTEISIAYRKLKSFVYHENFSLHLRIQLAHFETEEIDSKLFALVEKINKYAGKNKKELGDYFLKIGLILLPKAFTTQNINKSEGDAFYFSNANKQKEYEIESCTPFIDAPVELHIVCMLWIRKIGQFLDAEMDLNCYSGRLLRNSDDIYEESTIKLFKKYYINYGLWRDNAIKKAKELHKLNLDVVILNLDLKNYYNSVDFDFKLLNNSIFYDKWIQYGWLNEIINDIHLKYIDVLKKSAFPFSENKRILPIGLLSSIIISNYYLKDFDKIIENKLKPEFYGRYVDDILIVKSNPYIDIESENRVNDFIKNYLANQQIWNENISIGRKKENEKEYFIKIADNELLFQLKKVKLYHFLAHESSNLLDEFENEIRKNSSEFKFQPESKDVFDSFENASYKISYSDTINKIRSIDGFDVDKLGASKHLAKLINLTKNADKLDKIMFDELNERVMSYFSGKRSLELNSMWEKVFTFYVVNSAKKQLIAFAKEQIKNIFLLRYSADLKNSKK